ncbi:hypothetical protein [Pseudofrankia sp. BMG5.37]|uniref:hypothetical protein n=1 Tax=Pseudofrankia sp. BMG5.37 TaxID=3050035 RepID=UPI002893BF85|nr:hypothetical protein [Pseudofrankia sp. BMG5.37]MDT3441623.1 hypothetical protein [Pseudofrankia sp. BMG5.37]
MTNTPSGSSDDAAARWLRSATGQLEVHPPAELLPAALAAAPAARRRRRLAVAVPAGAAVLAAVVIGAGVLAGGRADSRTTIRPAAGSPTVVRGAAPAIPTEVPAAAGGPPLHLRYVDTPRLLTLTDAQRDEVDAGCATPYEAQLPPDAARLFVAVADRWGLQVLVADAGGGGSCRTFTGSGSVPDFSGLNGPLLWSPGRHDLTRPPATPVEVFNSGEDGSGRLGEWNARQWAAGQVSPQVALLVAALPTGDAVVVPFEPATGAFITRIQVTTPDLAQYQAIGQMPLTFYAYSSTGTLLAQATAATCGQVSACDSGPGTFQTQMPSPLSSPPAAPASGTGRPATPAAG